MLYLTPVPSHTRAFHMCFHTTLSPPVLSSSLASCRRWARRSVCPPVHCSSSAHACILFHPTALYHRIYLYALFKCISKSRARPPLSFLLNYYLLTFLKGGGRIPSWIIMATEYLDYIQRNIQRANQSLFLGQPRVPVPHCRIYTKTSGVRNSRDEIEQWSTIHVCMYVCIYVCMYVCMSKERTEFIPYETSEIGIRKSQLTNPKQLAR
jgi:hypothetical protein